MNLPDRNPFKIDWTINVTQLLAVVVFILSAVGAWYDVKQQINTYHVEAELKFKQLDKFMNEQTATDKAQDVQRERLASEVKEALRDSGREIKSDIRDLRNDILRSKKN